MKLEKWALIAEIVSGFAIVLTLIVLIVETRGNTDELRAATLANIAARTQVFPLALMTNPEVADVFTRLNSGADVSATDRSQIVGMVFTATKIAEESFLAFRDGRLEEEIWLTRLAFAVTVVQREPARSIWRNVADNGAFVEGFVQAFNRELSKRDAE